MIQKQINIFGEEIPVEEVLHSLPARSGKTFKQDFRHTYGFDEKHQCKNCKYFREFYYNCKHYFKCEMLGITHSQATDIRKRDYACKLYKEK